MKVPNQYRIGSALQYGVTTCAAVIAKLQHLSSTNDYGNNGGFVLPMMTTGKGFFFLCIASDGEGWEHVSVTVLAERRCPTWEEMCYIKSFFWDDEIGVMQLHAPKSDWVNNHPYCLHLWRPINGFIPLPPPIMVGLKGLNTQVNSTIARS